MLDELLRTAMISLVSCLIGLFVSLIPLKRMLENKLAESRSEAERIRDFERRRKNAIKNAVSAAGKAFFWLERGCRAQDNALWNGELSEAILEHKQAENDLKELDKEIVDAFNKEHC